MRRRVAALMLCALTAQGRAQNTPGTVPCRGQRVDTILVDAQAPTVTGLRHVPVIGAIARETHVVTRHEVIRRFLLLRAGDRCTELRRAESERILRAQPFLADATIDVVPDARGGVSLVVHTIDELSLILSGSVGSGAPMIRGARVGSGNLSGLGIATSVAWGYQPVLDDRLEIRATDYQMLGEPYVMSFALLRDPLGRDDHAVLTFPFRTDLQRLAWRASVGELRGHAQFEPRDNGRLTLGLGRDFAEAGLIGRLGPPGKLSLFGLSFTNERSWPDSTAEVLSDSGLRADTAAQFAGRFMELRASRLNALLGLRWIRFMRVRSFDALRGTQDVPLGVQFGTIVGRGIRALGANANDVFVASDFYAAIGTTRYAYRLLLQGEGRRARGLNAWDGLVGSGRLARYERASPSHTRLVSFEWSGTSRVLVPHSLSLGVVDGGMRGFNNAALVGGRRGIGRVDEQFYLGSPFSFGDFGLGWFSDVGQLWAGDLPYGVSTPLEAAAGVSMLFAAPMRSRRTWRLDVAMPVTRLAGTSRWEVRLSHLDKTAFFWREPGDVNAARARAVPASVYSWP